MRIPIACLAAAASLTATAAAPPAPERSAPAAAVQDCPSPVRQARGIKLFRHDAPVAFDLHHAVDRRIGRCPIPAIVRRDVDGRGAPVR